MSYNPEVRIYLHDQGDDTDTEITEWIDINTINIYAGRASVTEQPSPSVATFTVIAPTGTNPLPALVNQKIRIMTYGPGISTYGQCWYIGYVSDISASTRNWSNGVGILSTNYTCTSILGILNRFNVGASGYVKQKDGDRIAAIVADCGLGTTYISTPGLYEIAAHPNESVNALTLAQEAANSAKGVLKETIFIMMGKWYDAIGYSSAASRLAASIYTLNGAEINANNLTASTSINDCATVVRVNDSSGTGTTYTAASTFTSLYGYRYGVRDTKLHNATDAQTLGQELLAAKQEPKFKITSLTMNLGFDGVDTADLMKPPNAGTHIQFALDDPWDNSHLIGGGFDGFIEGYQVQFTRNNIIVTLNVSNYGDLYPYTYWSTAETATTTWQNAYTATTIWSDVI